MVRFKEFPNDYMKHFLSLSDVALDSIGNQALAKIPKNLAK